MGMAKYDRLLFILNLLRSRRNLNAERLADECGVTERSIYRDIVALSEANIPIYYDNGYKLASDNFLPPLNFDYEEFLSLKLALESSPLIETGKYGKTLRQVMTKLEARIPDAVRKQSRFTPRTTHIQISLSQEQDRCEKYYGTIETAATEGRVLRLLYESIQSGETERMVEPYFIVFRGSAFYFVAYCRLRGEMRTFRLDRINDLEILPETFIKAVDVDAETYFDGSWSVFSGDEVEVTVRFRGAAARVVKTGNHHPGEQVEPVGDGEVIYTATVRGLHEIQRWIVGFGAEAEVLKPENLRRNMADIGSYLVDAYNDKTAE
jgi:predicted DNA-binding transcriptional regulator YafY